MSGWSKRVGAGEDDLALAVGLHRVGEDDHGLGVRGETPVGVVEVLARVDPQAAAPDVGVVAADEEAELGVVGVVVAEAGREPGARLVQRRRHQAVTGGGPLGHPPLGLGLERLELLGQVGVVGRVGRQRPGRRPQRVGTHREAHLAHRDAHAGRREDKADLQVVLEVLADVGSVELARHADRFELAPSARRRTASGCAASRPLRR